MKQQLRKEIGMRLREIRKALGYTQVKMVSFFEVGRANYSRIEKGVIFPSPTILNTLCSKFHVSLDWLIANEGEMFIPDEQKLAEMKILKSRKYSREISDLLFHMEAVPLVRHAILSFFLEYKQKHQGIIEEILEGKPLWAASPA
jgi:transcriptional regulator with XRE-family HTH domain